MLTLADRLKLGLSRIPNATPSDLARACKVRQPSVSDWLSGRTKTLKAESYRLAAQFLHCRREWLETGLGAPGWLNVPHPNEGSGTALSVHEPKGIWPHTKAIKTNLVPVTGALEMDSDGQWQLIGGPDNEPIGHVLAVHGASNAYAIRVVGDALYPAVRHGACIVCEPDAPCVPGELVLVAFKRGARLVCELVAARPDSLLLTPVQGGQRQTVLLIDVAHMHAIASVVSGSKFRPT